MTLICVTGIFFFTGLVLRCLKELRVRLLKRIVFYFVLLSRGDMVWFMYIRIVHKLMKIYILNYED